METIDANGARLTVPLFIKAFKAAKKLAPARFLTLRVHPDVWLRFGQEHEEHTEIVQVGTFTGHLGKQITRVACVAAPNGLGDGVQVNQDKEADPTRLEFQIHGATELEVVGLAATAPQSAHGTVTPYTPPGEWPLTVQ